MGCRGSEVRILSPRPLVPGVRDLAASVFRSRVRGASAPAEPSPGSTPPMTRLLLALAATFARLLPGRAAYALARAIALGFWAADPSRRAAVRANLARIAPEQTRAQREALARRM